jgi:hypothetical protein
VARLASSVFVSAFLRAENSAGRHAVVVRKGAAEAGAIFVLQLRKGGGCRLFGPAPQSVFAQSETGERAFERISGVDAEADAQAYLARQAKFDADCWVLETDGELPLPGLRVIA